ncbi:response regulator transcription factor [Caldalkalibacillus salinus]|uniref:response regulator transcription factor n=1 Tax=Caldalkalibacillus salinus TaxID=2803787 RepID=UPI001920FAB8|nr:response regulator [Caldalkalibacillus salinus]
MKAIIIDDEKHVREGLHLLAEWDAVGIQEVLEACDGHGAIQLIKEHRPDIIFTDMRMPQLDGVALLNWLHEANMGAKVIVVSGYDDFKYTKHAITCGSFDYLLKPIDMHELNTTLRKAVEAKRLDDKDKLDNRKSASSDELYRLLREALGRRRLSEETIHLLRREQDLNVDPSFYQLAVLSLTTFAEQKPMHGLKEMPYEKVLSICNDVLRSFTAGIAFPHNRVEGEVIFFFAKPRHIDSIVRQAVHNIHRNLMLKCYVGVGPSVHRLDHAYEGAKDALYRTNLLDDAHHTKACVWSSHENATSKTEEEVIHLLDYADDMKWAIQSGRTEQIDAILDDIFATFSEQSYFSLEQLRVWEKQFDILKEHWLKECEQGEQDGLYRGTDYWHADGRFSFKAFQEEKRKEFNSLMVCFSDSGFNKERTCVQDIEAYIRQHYEKDIKLQDIADQFFLSKEYISRKFKQVYHKTMTDYVNSLRVEKAKVLLQNPHYKIYEVAEKVGYQNDKYFSKVFKRLEGMTPKAYQNQYNQEGNQC